MYIINSSCRSPVPGASGGREQRRPVSQSWLFWAGNHPEECVCALIAYKGRRPLYWGKQAPSSLLGAEGEGKGLVTHKSDRIRSLRVKPSAPSQRGNKEWGIQAEGEGVLDDANKGHCLRNKGGPECDGGARADPLPPRQDVRCLEGEGKPQAPAPGQPTGVADKHFPPDTGWALGSGASGNTMLLP